MSDLVKGALGGAWSTIIGWILPVYLVLQAATWVVAPEISLHPVEHFLDLSTTQQELVLVGAAILAGLGLASVQTPLYRILEGYLFWPRATAAKRIKRHKYRRETILVVAEGKASSPLRSRRRIGRSRRPLSRGDTAVNDASALGVSSKKPQTTALEQALQWSRFRYPADVEQIAPTALGNAIRRFETYAADRYQLDSQLLFYHLAASVPPSVMQAQERARANVDFGVCLSWASFAAALVSLVTWFINLTHISLLLFAAGAILTAVAAYWLAVLGTDEWAATVQAQVDLGRIGVAQAFGLTIPNDLESEREMWRWLNLFLRDPYADSGAAPVWLSYFRAFTSDKKVPQAAEEATDNTAQVEVKTGSGAPRES